MRRSGLSCQRAWVSAMGGAPWFVLLDCAVDCRVQIGVRLLDAHRSRGRTLSQNSASFADLAFAGGDIRQTDGDVIHLSRDVVENGHEAQPHVPPEPIAALKPRSLTSILMASPPAHPRHASKIEWLASINQYILLS